MIDFKHLPSSHEPLKIEPEIYKWWESQGYFRPEKQLELGLVDKNGPRFCLTMPPPNVTGKLHLGHAIVLSIEDFMTRLERMKQKITLYLPGMDHAGIATQNVVERELEKKGSSRKKIGREKFLEAVWEWKNKYGSIIKEQTKYMGTSCDWSRERFTMDAKCSEAVRTAFVKLFKKGLIYRGTYMINWCPGRCESAISDLEAISHDEQSSLWYIKYPIVSEEWKEPNAPWGSGEWAKGCNEFIELATTRPETLLGDTGIAIAENHPTYGKYENKKAILPVNGRKIPVFMDSYVDPEFGTGALKITPGHDPNDYEIGKKHNLEFITCMDEKGRMIPEYSGIYANMDRFECRKRIVEDLEKEGLLTQVEPYTHAIAHCQRCNTIIEPRISTQWFLKMNNLAQAALKAVKKKETSFIPDRFESGFFQWMENIRDWCISRQLWWGHRIPVWYCSKGHEISELEDPKKCPVCNDTKLKQDEDVLDTWFSSGLWPFETLGWPNTKELDYNRFYPTNMRETGYDIMFFWVAREMMLGIELTGKSPYEKVYYHGIVRDEYGKKISKSMPNIDDYDPLRIIENQGADSLRFTLLSSATPGGDINLNFGVLKASKNFCNKIWQSTNYILSNLSKVKNIVKINPLGFKENLTVGDRWILSRLHSLIKKANNYLEEYDYLNFCRSIRNFFWEEFCDWYIELTKIRIYNEKNDNKTAPISILLYVLEICLRLLHPVIPFLTEALWQSLPDSIKEGEALIISKWPLEDISLINEELTSNFSLILDLIHEIRGIRKEFNVKTGTKIPLIIQSGKKKDLIQQNKSEIIALANINENSFDFDRSDLPKHSARIVIQDVIAYLPLEGIIDMEKEKARIMKQLQDTGKQIQNVEKKLSSPFSKNAPQEIVQKEKDKLAELKMKQTTLRSQFEILT